TTAGTDGIGLGLALSKILIHQNGGEIAVRSAVEKGSEFEVTLPRAESIPPAYANETPAKQSDSPESARDLGGLHVLVADDDADCVETLARIIERSGATVTRAFSTDEAVSAIAGQRVDCVVTDEAMPCGGAKHI